MTRTPIRDMRRKQRRRAKVRLLRRRLEATTNPRERQQLIAKMRLISPRAPVPDR